MPILKADVLVLQSFLQWVSCLEYPDNLGCSPRQGEKSRVDGNAGHACGHDCGVKVDSSVPCCSIRVVCPTRDEVHCADPYSDRRVWARALGSRHVHQELSLHAM